ncbi:MAG: hypothetical protein ACXABY_06730 [Candidatus Thorarchaeota archaeon]|jgi:hypothetical protein
MFKWIKKLFRRKRKREETALPDALVWQTALLQDHELLVYIDEEAETHLITSKPYDPEKEYQVLVIRHEDLS